ncbi:MAG TPA: hypothetical protein VFI24_00550 [Pyrinomonadaceae bacterium]|nr:hypothetical protein [Pyrinomonadaceae bacterium]
MSRILQLTLVAVLFCSALATAQAPDAKSFVKDGLSFDYSSAWQLTDDSNGDAQQLTLTKTNSDVQMRVFVHKGRITPEKLPDAKKAFIDPYVAATAKQFVAMGAKPEQVPDSSEIGGVKADGTSINASLAGETGAAKIYWALVGQRVVVLTLFGPDKEVKKQMPAWDLLRTSLKIVDPKAAASPTPTP